MSEETKQYDPKEVEQELLEAAKRRAEDPAETAAMVYTMYKPEFLRRLKGLSSRAKTRLIRLLIEHPLNEKDFAATTQIEREAFLLGNSMLEAKFVMIMDTYKEGAEHLIQAQEELLFEDNVQVKENEDASNG